MTENNVQNSESQDRPVRSGSDSLGLATLVGVVVMLALSLWNVWNLNRLGERVARLEARGGRLIQPQGLDPDLVYDVNTSGAHSRGPADAPITIVEFSDFECPFCASVAPTLKQIEETYQGSVRVVWKHLPLSSIHSYADGAAQAAEAAAQQGKFWEYHDKLFADQSKLAPEDLVQHAEDLQLDMDRFEADLLDPANRKEVADDTAEADALGVSSTPSIFINGRFISGARSFETYAKVIDDELTKRNLPVPSRALSN